MNFATKLTFLRIVLAPVLVLFFYLPVAWSNIAVTALFSVAAITDWLDGYIARRYGQTSAFGAFLDPVADKLLVAIVLILLVQSHPTALFAIPVIIIISREIAVSALREWMANIGESATVAVSTLAKVKTVVQMVALILLLYREPIWAIPTWTVGYVLLYVAAALTLWSMIFYLQAAWPIFRDRQEK